jgi:hypothetical protein
MVNNRLSGEWRRTCRRLFFTTTLKSAAKIVFCLDNQKTNSTFSPKYLTKNNAITGPMFIKNKEELGYAPQIIRPGGTLANFIRPRSWYGLLSTVSCRIRICLIFTNKKPSCQAKHHKNGKYSSANS